MPSRQFRRTAEYTPHDRGWMVTVDRRSDGVTSAYARTLAKARVAIVNALAEALDMYPGNVVLDDDIRIGRGAKAALADARAKKAAALSAVAESHVATAAAARALVEEGLSLRDCAYLLGLSHGRVQQLVNETEGA